MKFIQITQYLFTTFYQILEHAIIFYLKASGLIKKDLKCLYMLPYANLSQQAESQSN